MRQSSDMCEIVQIPPNIDGVYLVVDLFTLGPQHTQLGMPTLHRPIEQQPILLQAAVSPISPSASHVVCLIYYTAPACASECAA
jgi:hypothetical protein